jgi:uncharacterized SAM-binding protein YcdF (DUF218 family)
MEIAGTIYAVLNGLFLPPGLGVSLVAAFGIGVFFVSKRSKLRTFLRLFFALSLVMSYAITTRTMGYQLASIVEGYSLKALPLEKIHEMQAHGDAPGAMVILGGGLKYDAREKPNFLNLNQRSLVRVHYGAFLAKNSSLPVLVSGGLAGGFDATESLIMARTLKDDYGVEARWQESKSSTTAENAFYSAQILKAEGIKKIILVTHAYHMRRSALVFEAQGLEVVMAPCGFLGGTGVDSYLAWLPALSGVEATFVSSHELVGLVYYRLRGYISRFSYSYHTSP